MICVDSYTLKDKDKLYLIPHSDAHVGSEQYNELFREYWRDTIKRITKNPTRGYLNGDMCESATKHLANSSYRQQMNINDQIEYTVDFLKWFDNWKCCTMGNHEIRLEKEFDIDINRIIANELKCTPCYQFYDQFMVNGKPFTVYVAHGKGSSMHHYTAESKIIRDSRGIEADILINGHNHRCGHFSLPLVDPSNPIGLKRKHYVFSGGFVSYQGSYADAMQLPPLPEAFCYLTIDKNLRVESNIFYIDERCPELLKV